MKQFIKKGLLLWAFVVGLVCPTIAQSTFMTVYMNDGTTQTFILDEDEQVYFADNTFLIIEEDNPTNSTSIKLADIRKITCDETTDVAENKTPDVDVFPNPVHDILTLRNLNGSQTIQIYALTGQMVKSLEAKSDQSIDVSDLPMGLYLIRTQSCTLKMIKL